MSRSTLVGIFIIYILVLTVPTNKGFCRMSGYPYVSFYGGLSPIQTWNHILNLGSGSSNLNILNKPFYEASTYMNPSNSMRGVINTTPTDWSWLGSGTMGYGGYDPLSKYSRMLGY